MTTYPLAENMFNVPAFQNNGVCYVVRTAGFKKKDADCFWVCTGGFKGFPHSGPFRSAEEAEKVCATANA